MLIENDSLERIWKKAVLSVFRVLSQLSAGEAGNDWNTSVKLAGLQTDLEIWNFQVPSINTDHSSALQGVDYSSQIAARFRCHVVSIVRFLVSISQNVHGISYECRHPTLKQIMIKSIFDHLIFSDHIYYASYYKFNLLLI